MYTITNNSLDEESLKLIESQFSLANGYIGIRNNFEEGYSNGINSMRGAYINGFYDDVEITYGEKLYGFPDTMQKLLNVIDGQNIKIFLDDEEISLFECEIIDYERQLFLDKGYSKRAFHIRTKKGKEVKVCYKRLVSFVYKELFIIDLTIEPVNYNGKVLIETRLDGGITNYIEKDDPRVGSAHAKLLNVIYINEENEKKIIIDEAKNSKNKVACLSRLITDVEGTRNIIVNEYDIVETFEFDLKNSSNFLVKNIYTDSIRNENLLDTLNALDKEYSLSFNELLEKQESYLKEFWNNTDISIKEKDESNLSIALNFNLFHLLQSAGKDEFSYIAAKGLSGEGYEGHFFWDTEIYMLPFFILTNPKLAKDMLKFRYKTLDGARNRAKEMGHKKGALYPWRTINGNECSAHIPAWAEYHIVADISYCYMQYYFATDDLEFLKNCGLEVLLETARTWLELGNYYKGEFRITNVAGPDEYKFAVDNNYYTNIMAKYNLKWAVEMFETIKKSDEKFVDDLCKKINFDLDELNAFEKAYKNMYKPIDEELNIIGQDDSFLRKPNWDFENTPKTNYPLLLHYNPLTINRFQVCKQADTVLANFLIDGEEDDELVKNSYDYYEKITTHDSSLSSCVFGIMASKLGYYEKAMDFFGDSALLDLENIHNNTKHGLHLANMGGIWMSIVNGFGGVRLKEDSLNLAPYLPEKWDNYFFSLTYKNAKIKVEVLKDNIILSQNDLDEIEIFVYNKKYILTKGQILKVGE